MTRCHSIVYRLEWNGDIAAKGGVSPLRSGLRRTIYCQLGMVVNIFKQLCSQANRAFKSKENHDPATNLTYKQCFEAQGLRKGYR